MTDGETPRGADVHLGDIDLLLFMSGVREMRALAIKKLTLETNRLS